MAKVKYTVDTVYIAEPEKWDAMREAPSIIAEEMYKDLLFANSGALMLSEHLTALVSDTKSKSVTFLYPEVDREKVAVELYSLLRGSEISFNNNFKYTLVDVKGDSENPVGLEVKFIEK